MIMFKNTRSLARIYFPKTEYYISQNCVLQNCLHKLHRNIMPTAFTFHTSNSCKKKEEKNVMVFKDFSEAKDRSKNTFLEMINLYEGRHKQRRGHVEFVYSAMKHMEEYGVERDLEVYKALINVMPKGTLIPTNIFQVEFMHYPKQQQCIVDLLEKMEDYGIMPDAEMEPMLLNIFGKRGFPLRKYWRMMYWMPKFKNLSPWKVPNPPPDDAMQLAKLAIERITSVDLQTVVDIYQCEDVEDSIDKTWIVTGMSPMQEELLKKHPADRPIIVEAGGLVWLRRFPVRYFVLKSEPDKEEEPPPPEDIDDVSKIKVRYFGMDSPAGTPGVVAAKSVHEQADGTVYGVCATGTASKDSALSWVRLLQRRKAPTLEHTPVLFKFRQASGELVPFSESVTSDDKT